MACRSACTTYVIGSSGWIAWKKPGVVAVAINDRNPEYHDIWEVNVESVYHETDVAEEHPYRTAPETPEMQALATTRPD